MPINLLPQEFKPKGYVVTVSHTLRKVAVLLLTVFLVGSVAILGAFIFTSQRIKGSNSMQEELKTEIETLEATEQRLILLKDRLDKVKTIEDANNSGEEVTVLGNVSDLFSEGITPKGILVSKGLTQVSVYADSLANLSHFIEILKGSGQFANIAL